MSILFDMALEPLAIAVHASKEIEGINIDCEEAKIALYADDIVCYLRNPVRSIKGLMDLTGTFGTVAGYKVNENISILSGFNISAQDILKIIPNKWQDKGMGYLKIWIFRFKKKIIEGNIIPILKNNEYL